VVVQFVPNFTVSAFSATGLFLQEQNLARKLTQQCHTIDNNDLIVVLDDHLQQLFLAVPGRHFARYAAGRHQYRSIIRLQWE